MPTKQRAVHVYRGLLTYADTSGAANVDRKSDVADVMDFLNQLPWNLRQDPNAYLPIGNSAHALYIHQIDRALGIITGQFASIRYGALPHVEQNGLISPLTIPADAGIYDPNHFVYFVRNHHLLLEFNPSAPRIKSLGKYLEDKMSCSSQALLDSAAFFAVIKEDVVNALDQMGSIAELEVEIHRDLIPSLRNSDYFDQLNMQQTLMPEAAVLKLGFKREAYSRRGGSQNKQPIIDLALRLRDLFSSTNSKNLKMKAKVEQATNDEGALITLDLLSAKYAEKIPIQLNEDRTINSDSVYREMQELYARMNLVTQEAEQP